MRPFCGYAQRQLSPRLILHAMGCAWYFVGSADDGWVFRSNVEASPVTHRYATPLDQTWPFGRFNQNQLQSKPSGCFCLFFGWFCHVFANKFKFKLQFLWIFSLCFFVGQSLHINLFSAAIWGYCLFLLCLFKLRPLRSLYWMFCQMGFGLSEIVALTDLEVLFGLTASIAGLAIFSFFLGTDVGPTTILALKWWKEKHHGKHVFLV